MNPRDLIERLHEFASQPAFADPLRIARREFVTLRGDLFDSDRDYEARLGVFLDWFLCDRHVRIDGRSVTPAQHFIDAHHPELSPDDLAFVEAFRDSGLRLLVCKKVKKDGSALFEDVVFATKFDISHAQEIFIALERKQFVEARVIDFLGEAYVSPYWMPRPTDGIKPVIKAAKLFRSSSTESDLDAGAGNTDLARFIHRVAELSNRSNRYPHVKVVEIFKELRDSPLA